MEFVQMVLLEGILLISAGIIFFGGIRGTLIAVVALSGINFFVHDSSQFWYWEVPLLLGGSAGIGLLFLAGKLCNKNSVVGGMIGGLTSLILFGAFATPVVVAALWALVFGMGIIPKGKKNQMLASIAPSILRMLLGVVGIIYGNVSML